MAVTMLKRGMSGSGVKRMQEDLIALGFKFPRYGADGQFGEETEAVVKQFQKMYNLQVDGIVGPETAQMIKSLLTYQAIEQGGTYEGGNYTNGGGGGAVPDISQVTTTEPPEWVKEWVKSYVPGTPAAEEVQEPPQWVKEWVASYQPAAKLPGIQIAGINIDWKWIGLGAIAFLIYLGKKEKYF